ncbi:hypothetical protein [uncultured Thomasclavelia sp.]|uniref:hypothetical protein n=1 Tax=uncultured Thomasclavelia sp. TaxID=3025759 RepID=UPI0025CBC317|nr:hypothetical protein [uncultured Thomasclavelia sp.]
MKQFIKLLFTLTLISTLSFGLSGCTSNNTDDNNTDDQENSSMETTDDLSTVDDRIDQQFNNDYTVSQEDVSEAISYINENIDNVKDKDTAINIYERASFLQRAAETGNVDDSNRIKELATTTKEYAANIYRANDDEVDNIIDESKAKFDEFKNDFKDGIDSFVDDFMKFF